MCRAPPPTHPSTLLSSPSLLRGWMWEERGDGLCWSSAGFSPLWHLIRARGLCLLMLPTTLLFKLMAVDFFVKLSFWWNRGSPRCSQSDCWCGGVKDWAVSQAYQRKAPPLITFHYSQRARNAESSCMMWELKGQAGVYVLLCADIARQTSEKWMSAEDGELWTTCSKNAAVQSLVFLTVHLLEAQLNQPARFAACGNKWLCPAAGLDCILVSSLQLFVINESISCAAVCSGRLMVLYQYAHFCLSWA